MEDEAKTAEVGGCNIPVPGDPWPCFPRGRLPIGHNPHDRYWGHGDAWELKENVVDINAAEQLQGQSYRYQHQQDVIDANNSELKEKLFANSADLKAKLDNQISLQIGDVRQDIAASRSMERGLYSLQMTTANTTLKAYDTTTIMLFQYTLEALAKLDNDDLESARRNNVDLAREVQPKYWQYWPYPPAQPGAAGAVSMGK
jgi:hypothetical protein